MDKLASRLNKAVTRAGGGINNMIAAKALKELGWTHELAYQIEILKRELVEETRSRELAVAKAWEFADRIKELEAALRQIAAMTPDPEFGAFPIESAIDVARAALEGKDEL